MESNYINPSFSRPVSGAHGFSIVREQACGASVLTLLGWCLPLAVAWFVVAVIVNASNAMTWTWWIAHVFKKRFERLSPPFAYLDSTASVLGVVGIAGVVTSLLNTLPATMNFRATLAVTRNVLAKCVGGFRMCARHAKSPTKVSCVKAQRESQLLSVPFHSNNLSLEAQANGN